jgi:hypothetical protein
MSLDKMDFSQHIHENTSKICALLSCKKLKASTLEEEKYLDITFEDNTITVVFSLSVRCVEGSDEMCLDFVDADWFNANTSDINRVHSWDDLVWECEETFGKHVGAVKEFASSIRMDADKLRMQMRNFTV